MTLPNILMIVTDQQRRDTVGVYGSRICRTPNMDRLAAEGMRFDRAYTPVGLCSPVRASFFSGQYPHAHGVLTNVALHPVRQSLPPSADRLSPQLKRAGYRMDYVGKWHVSHCADPTEFGFEEYVSLDDYVQWRRQSGLPIPDEMSDYSTQVAALDPVSVNQSRPAWLCDQAIQRIDEYARQPDRPFFLRLDFHGPHFPNVVPEPFKSMYEPSTIDPWPNADDPLDNKPAVQRIKQQHWGTAGMHWSQWQPLVATYFGEISLIDSQVGRVLDALEVCGLTSNTLVVWTTDHGDTIGAHGICNKDYTMYEEIYQIPLIVRWPKLVAPGSVCPFVVHHFLDLCSTFLEITGADPPADLHGRSLLPLLRGDVDPNWPEEAFCEFHGSHMGLYSMRLLRTRRYSYIYHANDIDELYDHETDPYQMHNLACTPGGIDLLTNLRRMMVAWMQSTDDHLYNEWTVMWLTGDRALAEQAPGRRRTRW